FSLGQRRLNEKCVLFSELLLFVIFFSGATVCRSKDEERSPMSYVDFKVVLLGRENGGKTSLVYRYLHGKFAGDMPYQGTIGAAFAARRVECKGRILTMGIWDTAGGEKYKSMSNLYYRNAKAAIICYDLTSPYSFERAQDWVHELREHEVVRDFLFCFSR
ncbi:unnamed protein product, partial [Cyprideis torosa]